MPRSRDSPSPAATGPLYVGETPVIVARDKDGKIHAMVNRCAHKGALLCVEACGKRRASPACITAGRTTFTGKLIGVPFKDGVGGQGGMPTSFDLDQHGLERLRVEIFQRP